MDRLAPAWDAPALLATSAALFEVSELPEVVDFVECADLHEPSCMHVSILPATFTF